MTASVFFITGCTNQLHKPTTRHVAPVTNGWTTSCASSIYHVQAGDSLYSVAFRYGLDAEKLAKINNLTLPYHIKAGQSIKLSPEACLVEAKKTNTEIKAGTKSETKSETKADIKTVTKKAKIIKSKPVKSEVVKSETITVKPGQWIWPTPGKITDNFDNTYGGNKGVNISGKLGQAIKASASGQVVYCGTGLRGYGLLIIIKHNAKYLSAYAHNNKALVKEGQKVKQGQIIAEMGRSDASDAMLHFEIRQSGTPVDPLKFLPPRK